MFRRQCSCSLAMGPSAPRLQSKVARLGLSRSVVFTGVREDVSRLVSAFDVFLFPSFYEGLGLAVIEAQALGIPCVISDAIPPEVDIGLGLVEKLSLQQSTSTWIEAIRRRADRKQGIASEATADAAPEERVRHIVGCRHLVPGLRCFSREQNWPIWNF